MYAVCLHSVHVHTHNDTHAYIHTHLLHNNNWEDTLIQFTIRKLHTRVTPKNFPYLQPDMGIQESPCIPLLCFNA